MGIFSDWFKRKPVDTRRPENRLLHSIPPPARSIQFDPNLVDSLKDDHIELVQAYGRLGEEAEAGRFGGISEGLIAFKTRLEAHLLTENVRFYVYLEQSMGGDPENMAIIRSFRQEMNGIARGVVDFVRRYQQQPLHAGNRDAFMQEYEAVGKLLVMRVEREENNLYPLYHA